MKVAIVAFAFLAVASAASLNSDAEAQVVSQVAEVNPDGSYSQAYETQNGIHASEHGNLKKVGNEEAIEVQGSYEYTGADGVPIKLSYVADENGFQPQGAHLPVAPEPQPIPEAILRAIQWAEAHPYVEPKH